MLDTMTRKIVNDVDLTALGEVVEAVEADKNAAKTNWKVVTDWTGQFRSQSTVNGFSIGGKYVPRPFRIIADEPNELLGTNSAPNPQELLISGLNACMMVGYVAQAALRGINLKSIRIETEGDIDLRGFLGLDEATPNGYEQLRSTITIEGDGSDADWAEIREAVEATSPNYFNMARPIEMVTKLA